MYAYTASQLQTAILRLFTRCECILPNLFVGVLTRESTVGALACGLSADQILGYLRQHAHPHVASRSPVVPEVSGPVLRNASVILKRRRKHVRLQCPLRLDVPILASMDDGDVDSWTSKAL